MEEEVGGGGGAVDGGPGLEDRGWTGGDGSCGRAEEEEGGEEEGGGESPAPQVLRVFCVLTKHLQKIEKERRV